LENIDIDGRIILNWMLKITRVTGQGMDLSGSGQGLGQAAVNIVIKLNVP
jgi:hypothetical protein